MFEKIKMPLIKRIYPQLIADKLCSVQPLSGPSSLIYYLRHKYSSNSKFDLEDIPNPQWKIKQKKKKIWRDITDPWSPSSDVD